MRSYRTQTPEDTDRVAALAAATLRPGDLVRLTGPLGSGKTTFTRGIVRALRGDDRVASPSFVLVRSYPVRGRRIRTVHHVDAYRCTAGDTVLIHGLRELLGDVSGIVLVEWADRLGRALPAAALRVTCSYGRSQQERVIRFDGDALARIRT